MEVRTARPDDLEAIRDLLHEFKENYEGGALGLGEMDVDILLEYIRKNLQNKYVGVFLLDNDKGIFIGQLSPLIYKQAILAHEIFWYTRPEGKSAGLSLLDAFHTWGKANYASYFQIPSVKPRKAFERLGYSQIETIYARRA